MKTAVQLLEEMDAPSPLVLGEKRIAHKKELLAQFERYRKIVTITLIFLYALALAVAAGAIMLAYTNPAPLTKGLLPYAGGAAFVGLLEFARRLTREWLLMTLPLAISKHATDEQLSRFVGQLLSGVNRDTNARRSPETRRSALR